MEFLAGTVAGLTTTFIGHPLDTVKVRMQAGHIHGLFDCILRTLKADGFRGFYQGLTYPLSSIPLINAVVFGTYAQAQRFLGDDRSFWSGILCGSYAGLVNCAIVCPIELVKVRMQIQSNDVLLGDKRLYKNSFHAAYIILTTEGFFALNKGMVATLYREIPGYAGQFASYEGMKYLFTQKYGECTGWMIFVSGIVGGFNAWFWAYPQDVIKTRLQVEHSPSRSFDGGFWRVAKQIYSEEGWRGFWKGFSACGSRAVLVNGFGFIAYEHSLEFFQGYSN